MQAWLTLNQFILLGANDACVQLPTNHQHVPLDRYKVNLTRIITHPNVTAHKPKIFLVTPPPLDQIRITELDLALGHPAASRHTKISASYSEAVREVAAENSGVTLIDLQKAIMDTAIAKTPGFDTNGPALGDPESGERGYLEQLLPDGLHLSAESYRIFYGLVQPHLGAEWANTAEEDKVAYVLPDWRQAPWLEEDAHLKGPSI
jgi:lysophospholipase L1-like esterase